MILRDTRTLEEAYYVSIDLDYFFKPTPPPRNNPQPPLNKNNNRNDINSDVILRRNVGKFDPKIHAPTDKGKSNVESYPNTSKNKFFKCDGYGHMAAKCPTRTLNINEVEEKSDEEN